MPDKNCPMISIVVAVRNGADTLQQCINSVAQQSYADKEMIVIDGDSRDGTVDLIKANQEKIDFWISEPDNGIYNAWNKGLGLARGDWICFLGADDYFWDASVLGRIAEQLKELKPEIRVAYGQIMVVNNSGETLYSLGESWEKIKARFRQVMCIPHPGTFHHRSLFKQHGSFDESYHIAGDYEFLLRELNSANAFFISGVTTTAMRSGGISSVPTNSLLQLREVRRAQKINGITTPGNRWVLAITRVYIRLALWSILGERNARKILDIGRRLMGLPPFWTRT